MTYRNPIEIAIRDTSSLVLKHRIRPDELKDFKELGEELRLEARNSNGDLLAEITLSGPIGDYRRDAIKVEITPEIKESLE